MNILATDTATEACSAALLCGEEVLSKFEIAPRQHNRLLFEMCKELFASAGITASQLDAIAFGRGPGTFVGVRVAALFTQGIAFIHDLPVVTVSDLHVLAQMALNQSDADRVLVTLDARMGEIYYGYFHRQNRSQVCLEGEEAVIASNALTLAEFDGAICGDGISACLKDQKHNITLLENIVFPDAKTILTIAQEAIAAGRTLSAEQALPVYLRHPVMRK